MNFEPSARSTDFLERVRRFMADHIEPVEAKYWAEVHELNQGGDWKNWRIHPRHGTAQGEGEARPGCGTCSCPTRSWARGSPRSSTRPSPRPPAAA